MEKQTNTPALRFPEFKGEWVTKKVGELCDSIVPGRNKPTSFDGTIPWITTPDIQHNGTITFSKSGLNISREEAKKVGSKIVPVNSIVVACVGELGLAAITGTEIVINQQLHAFIPKKEINFRFLLYQVSLQKKYMDRVATKTAVPYMNKDNCNAIPISYPTLPEQQKIASFFTAIDQKIQALQQQKQLLQQYKKGIMQQLFTQQLRFKDDNGQYYPDWEEKKLGQVGKFISGTGFTDKEQGGSNGIPFLKVSDMNLPQNNIEIKTSNNYVSEEQVLRMKYKVITAASLIFAKVGAAIFLERKRIAKNFLIDNNMMAFIPKGDIGFYFHLFNNIRLSQFAQVGALPSYNSSDLATISIQIPCLAEQTKIANFLSSLDEKINHAETQIQQATQWKKGLLQTMFC